MELTPIMEVSFTSRSMQKACSSEKEMRKTWGAPMAKKLQQRLAELRAASTLEDVSRLPPARCHELTANRKGQVSVDLVHPHRLILVPDHKPVPARPEGGLDWTQVTRIVVLEVCDPH